MSRIAVSGGVVSVVPGSASPWPARAATAIPDVLILPALGLCLAVSTTIAFNDFTPWIVLPATLLVTVVCWRWRPGRYLNRGGWQSSLAALVFVVGWLVVNLPYAAQWLDVSRDPGFYTLEGVWLSHHSDPNIPLGSAGTIVQTLPQVNASLPSFVPSGGNLQAQGSKLVPGILAIGGWIGGTQGVLVTDLVIGAVALLFFYGLCRRILGSWWSLVALVILGVSMPFTYFSRAAFTEPLLIAVTFAGLTFLIVAARRGKWQHFLIGGALVGSGGLARIDGAALIIGLAIGLAMFTFGTHDKKLLRRRRVGYALAVGVGLVLTVIGGIETYIDSVGYVQYLMGQFQMLLVAAIGVSLLGFLVTLGSPWRWARKHLSPHARLWGIILAALVLLVSAGLITRPLWYFGNNSSICNPVVGALQKASGIKVNCWASYDQLSVNWLAMYYGWPLMVAAFLGIAAAFWRAIIHREEKILPIIGVVVAPSLLYLIDVSISADQIWAMRHFLPVTIPGFILLGIFFLRGLSLLLVRAHLSIKIITRSAIGFITVTIVAFPLLSWGSLFPTVEHGGVDAQTVALCSAIDGRPVILSSDNYWYGGTIRVLCNVPVVVPSTLNAPLSASSLAQVAQAWNSAVIIAFDPRLLPWESSPAPSPTLSGPVTSWPQKLNQRPTKPYTATTKIWVATINTDGTVSPVEQ